ncbi:MAG: hypothetical protein LBR11_08005 [Deltaproteobacteria bacterium]|jgi:hypothetical protein|nr:hypothetical protein [Deltaproteobacteria bacterium]
MPLPLLVPIAIGALGLFGVGKTIKSAVDTSEAKSLDSTARLKVQSAERKLELSREEVNASFGAYGQAKREAVERNLAEFVNLFQQLKNVDFTDNRFDDLLVGDFTLLTLKEMQMTCELFSAAFHGQGAGTAAGAGALTALGAYGAAKLLATASTSAAATALTGAASANATLAWLGGGTLAAGGLGVTGGLAVLGIMVAGPALAIFGTILGAQASKKLTEAKENFEKSEKYEAEIDNICDKIAEILETISLISQFLSIVRDKSKEANLGLQTIIEVCGPDYSSYTAKAKEAVFKAVKLAQIIKAIVDTPLLDEKGELLEGLSHKTLLLTASIPEDLSTQVKQIFS